MKTTSGRVYEDNDDAADALTDIYASLGLPIDIEEAQAAYTALSGKRVRKALRDYAAGLA